MSFFVLALVFTLTILDNIIGRPPPIALPLLFLGLWCSDGLSRAIQRLRDLPSGHGGGARMSWTCPTWRRAVAKSTLLRQIHNARQTQAGPSRLALGRNTDSATGVIYSPASKIVWALEESV